MVHINTADNSVNNIYSILITYGELHCKLVSDFIYQSRVGYLSMTRWYLLNSMNEKGFGQS